MDSNITQASEKNLIPNFTKRQPNIEISVYDTKGRLLKRFNSPHSSEYVTADLLKGLNLAKGIYLLKVNETITARSQVFIK